MGFLLVMKAELVRSLIMMRRYWFRSITGMIIGYSLLVGLILAFTTQGDDMVSKYGDVEGATNVVLGLIIGMFAFGIVGMFSHGLQEMAQSGQLEQLCMSPHGLVSNFLARSAVGSINSVLTSSLMMWAITTTIGGKLHADLPWLILLLGLTFINLIGFGFMVGGLVLVFKQTGQIAMIIRMAMVALAVGATEEKLKEWPVFVQGLSHLLPITDATVCLKYVLVKGQMTADGVFSPVYAQSSFLFLLISCVVWTTIGITLFRLMENWSRSKGTLGAY